MWVALVSYYRWQFRVTIRLLVLFRVMPPGMARVLLGGLAPRTARGQIASSR